MTVDFIGSKLNTGPDFTFDYTDHASFDVTVTPGKDDAPFSSIMNDNGQTSNWIENNPDCTNTALGQGNYLNITGGSGQVNHDTGKPDWILLTINNSFITVGSKEVCTDGSTTTTPSQTLAIPLSTQDRLDIDGTVKTTNLSPQTGVNMIITLTPQK